MATIQERLEARLQRAENGCLEWRGSTQPTGYGQIWADKTMKYTHRVAWELAKGRIPDGMMVCHTCDNRLCCDVDHLFLGTAADNNADMCAKGRQARGLAFPWAKLTQDDKAEIIRLYESGVYQKEIAALMGCAQSTVSLTVNDHRPQLVSI